MNKIVVSEGASAVQFPGDSALLTLNGASCDDFQNTH